LRLYTKINRTKKRIKKYLRPLVAYKQQGISNSR